ncbi:hypothetical protein ANCCAN_16775 [Ancylostoma caninum]|uniref:Uncharacterized protein n=1 Tax=Ancylostoma caninum TaxID=29170 RepID=A0A368FYS0_ANCCA|nr:hypothetical protein ANCCAN_16775 [Ancylostoma caninum]
MCHSAYGSVQLSSRLTYKERLTSNGAMQDLLATLGNWQICFSIQGEHSCKCLCEPPPPELGHYLRRTYALTILGPQPLQQQPAAVLEM